MSARATPRRAMGPARRAAVLARFDGRCAKCGADLAGKPWVADHVIALELGGADEVFQCQPLCTEPCNRIKTALDRKHIAKVQRLAGETCAGPTRRPVRSRPFGAISRSFDGQLKTTKRAARAARQDADA